MSGRSDKAQKEQKGLALDIGHLILGSGQGAMKWSGRSDWNAKAPFTVLRRGEVEMCTVSDLEKNISKIDLHCPMARPFNG